VKARKGKKEAVDVYDSYFEFLSTLSESQRVEFNYLEKQDKHLREILPKRKVDKLLVKHGLRK